MALCKFGAILALAVNASSRKHIKEITFYFGKSWLSQKIRNNNVDK